MKNFILNSLILFAFACLFFHELGLPTGWQASNPVCLAPSTAASASHREPVLQTSPSSSNRVVVESLGAVCVGGLIKIMRHDLNNRGLLVFTLNSGYDSLPEEFKSLSLNARLFWEMLRESLGLISMGPSSDLDDSTMTLFFEKQTGAGAVLQDKLSALSILKDKLEAYFHFGLEGASASTKNKHLQMFENKFSAKEEELMEGLAKEATERRRALKVYYPPFLQELLAAKEESRQHVPKTADELVSSLAQITNQLIRKEGDKLEETDLAKKLWRTSSFSGLKKKDWQDSLVDTMIYTRGLASVLKLTRANPLSDSAGEYLTDLQNMMNAILDKKKKPVTIEITHSLGPETAAKNLEANLKPFLPVLLALLSDYFRESKFPADFPADKIKISVEDRGGKLEFAIRGGFPLLNDGLFEEVRTSSGEFLKKMFLLPEEGAALKQYSPLAVAHELAALANGVLTAERKAGEMEFRLRLPLSPRKGAGVRMKRSEWEPYSGIRVEKGGDVLPEEGAATKTEAPVGNLPVIAIIIDDEEMNRVLHRKILERWNVPVYEKTASSGEEGVRLFEEVCAQYGRGWQILVVTDCSMETKTAGGDAAKKIREKAERENRPIKILMVTGELGGVGSENAQTMKARYRLDEILPKPTRPAMFGYLINTWFGTLVKQPAPPQVETAI